MTIGNLKDGEVRVDVERNKAETGDSVHFVVGGSKGAYLVELNFKRGHTCRDAKHEDWCKGNHAGGKLRVFGPIETRNTGDPGHWCKHVKAALDAPAKLHEEAQNLRQATDVTETAEPCDVCGAVGDEPCDEGPLAAAQVESDAALRALAVETAADPVALAVATPATAKLAELDAELQAARAHVAQLEAALSSAEVDAAAERELLAALGDLIEKHGVGTVHAVAAALARGREC
jgi:hypothetical protein